MCTGLQEKLAASPILLEANDLLSRGQFSEALDIYSQVLFDDPPGHLVALLNRSLCYLLLDHPSLAAIDACKDGSRVWVLSLTAKL
jgi:hypothetical protein